MFFDKKVNQLIKEKSNNNKEYAQFNKYIIERIKNEIEEMWQIYEVYAPKGFKQNMLVSKEDFYQRWWEMYLGTKLIEYGFNIETTKADIGPDFKICLGDKIYWIEAIAPELGNKEDKLIEIKTEGEETAKLPKEEFLLRISSAIFNKTEKFEEYLKKGIVSTNDKMIIAISTCNLSQYGSLMDFPCLAVDSILYDIGNVAIDLNTGKQLLTNKGGLKKYNGIYLDTDIFKNGNSVISGILYTNDEPLNNYNKMFIRTSNFNELDEEFINKFIK